jgi:branched-chain amino acid transport system permease protein
MIEYIISLLILTTIWSLLTQSYNLSFGLTGLFNLGHIIFYGIGAYTAAILSTQYETTFMLHLLVGFIIAGGFAGLLGLLTLRLSGHYLAISTLGAAMIAIVVATNWMDLTNGPLGIRGIAEPDFFGITFTNSWTILGFYLSIVVVCQFLLYQLFNSPFGRLQRAIQDDEIAAQSLGKNTFNAKVWSLVLSAGFAAMAGVMYAHYRLFLDPTIFSLHEIVFLILMIIVGGRGNFWGAIVGTILIVALGEIPRFMGFSDSIVGAARNLVYASTLIACMFYAPKGILSVFKKTTS